MYDDIDALERQWEKYQRKRLMRISFFALIIIFLLAVPILYTTFKSSSNSKQEAEKLTNNSINSSIKSSTNKEIKQIPSIAQVSKVTSSNSSKTEVKEHKSTPKMVIKLSDKKVNLSVVSTKAEDQKIKDSNSNKIDNLQAVAIEKNVTKKKIELKVVDANSSTIIKEIKSRFPETKDYNDAIYLARYYYKKHQYKKAAKWAMNANVVDNSAEESWLIYAKAEAKRGYRAQALRILQNYYDRSGSESAKILIDKIRKGEAF